jgi:tRNA-splicing ligase RtcB (3'-phosphate/5'-hydroxy nucleic acid ligase)
MAKDSYHGPLEQVDDTCWRIPKSYKPGMRVDGLIFTDARGLEQIKKDQAPEQVANVAFLPGIQYASLAMPDIHWGYGFCIGGVCATDPEEGGVISPGGVGYDINCLSADSQIVHAFGYARSIGEMAESWREAELTCYQLEDGRQDKTAVERWFAQQPRAAVLRVHTEAGDEVRATADHPFYTPAGMVPLGQLKPGDRVAVSSFRGVPYEPPSDKVILSEEDVLACLGRFGKGDRGHAALQIVNTLKRRGLLPLRYSSPGLPYLCKLLGFVMGDGNLHFQTSTTKGAVHFYGDGEDLETIRADLQAIGVKPSRIYARQRQHAIHNGYGVYTFERKEQWVKVGSSALAILLAGLGAPVGKKAEQDYDPPAWLEKAPRWQQRLFLAGLFGAELSSPGTITGHGTLFNAPTLSMNKRQPNGASGRRFLQTIARWLEGFGVSTQNLIEEPSRPALEGPATVRLRLVLSSRIDSLLNLWSRVGYEYNRKRRCLGALAVQYLKRKQQVLQQREQAAKAARELKDQGVAPAEIYRCLSGPHVNRRFLERSLWEGRTSDARIGSRFPTFAAYCRTAGEGTARDGLVWETVASIAPVEHAGPVYDFTVRHADHNFVASGFVVSNCGVRLVRSNLFYRDVKRHVRLLVDELFRAIPTGAGKSGRYAFRGKELRQLLTEGAPYLTGRDLAEPRDVEYAEAHGRLEGADPDAVSEHAQLRGAEQCGTLGSGNHFLEVQVVDHIFDEDAAGVLGLEKDMVCVMIHSGSRGLGYQVCDDALVMLRKAPAKYGLDLPDRQLACAPVNSPEGQRYIAAMRAAANFAWCNRQLLMQQARDVFAAVFGQSWQELQMNLIYDVCHNIAKFEEHVVDGKRKRVWVHRKGATRAFPPGHPEIPPLYRHIGQPVIIPGDMGRASWVLVGQPGSMERTFGTTCHGAGRAMSRTAAVKAAAGRRIDKELEARGVIARAQSRKGLMEEQPNAYKNVDDVVDIVHRAGLSRKVARMRPIGVIKG